MKFMYPTSIFLLLISFFLVFFVSDADKRGTETLFIIINSFSEFLTLFNTTGSDREFSEQGFSITERFLKQTFLIVAASIGLFVSLIAVIKRIKTGKDKFYLAFVVMGFCVAFFAIEHGYLIGVFMSN